MKNKSAIGLSGEFYVLFELHRRGFQASLTFGATKAIDIFASSDSGKVIKIQVKTNSTQVSKHGKWFIDRKIWDQDLRDMFYVFVMINPLRDKPEWLICKACDVASFTKSAFEVWLKGVYDKEIKYKGKVPVEELKNISMIRFSSKDYEEKKFKKLSWEDLFV